MVIITPLLKHFQLSHILALSTHTTNSLFLKMTAKDCGHHEEDEKKHSRNFLAGLGSLVVLVLIAILVIFLVLRPTKPHFILLEATVYSFNLTAPNYLSSTFQVTLSSRNPNARIGIYYDRLDVYLSYRGQQISLPTLIPSAYQGHKDVNVWSPFLYGTEVPISPYLAQSLSQDQFSGSLMVNVKVNGRVKWKVGTFISGKYHLFVTCPAYIGFGNKGSAIPVGPGPVMKFRLVTDCHVDV